MVHSHWQWAYIPTRAMICQCDVGNWLAKARLVKTTPWTVFSSEGDGKYVQALAGKAKSVAYVRRPLFIHN
jgi:hypothetical protein